MFFSLEVYHQTLAVLPIIFNEISIGFIYGWVAPTLREQEKPQSEFHFSEEQCSWIGSLVEFGRIFGPFISGYFINRLGRRVTLVTCTVIFFAVWPFVFFTRSVPVLYATRFIFGFIVGLNDVCSTIYVCENCNPHLRAIFSSVSILVFYGAELVEFAMATYLSYAAVAAVNSAITFVAMACVLTTTETPHFLITRKNMDKAEKNFNWLRGKSIQHGDGDFEKLRMSVEHEQSEKIDCAQLFKNEVHYKPILLVVMLCLFMMMTGYSAIMSFVSIAFGNSETLTSNQFTTLYGLCQFLSVCSAPFFIDKFDRRTILMTSFGLEAVIHLASTGLFYAKCHHIYVPHISWLIFATVTLYAMIFSAGLHTIFYTIRGELFPQNIKAVGGTIAITAHSIAGFWSTKLFLYVADAFGMHTNFLIFALCSAAGMLFVYLWLPETRGKTLAEIHEELRGEKNRARVDKLSQKKKT